jgi:hypothetical protein
VGGSITYCASADLGVSATDELTFEDCDQASEGSFSLDGPCVTYLHTGTRGQDLICLQVCDTNGICDDYQIVFVSGPTLTLPFFDDFSTTSPYPDENFWLDRDVFINSTLAERPLSIGVATFDGLDANGTPYEGGLGYSDNLTSSFIDLSDEGEVYFSFFAQPKGVGIKPRTSDSLAVDFRNAAGQWVRVWQMEGLPNSFPISDPAPDFLYNRWMIPDSFLHSQFQFRLRNRSKNEGLQELWHVDYVRVGTEEITREAFRDIAFRFGPTSILSPYSSMPAHQFEKPEVRKNIISQVNNLDLVDLTMNDPTFTVSLEGQTLLKRTFIEPVQLWLLSSGPSMFDFDMNDNGSTNYETLQNGLVNALQPGENVKVINELSFSRSDEILGANSNNKVRNITHFSNYYAYDDGSAESAIIDRGSTGVRPTQLAMAYHNNVDDELQGIQFHFPHIEGNSSSLFFNWYVWVDSLDEEPDFTQLGVKVFYADAFFDTLGGFTTYNIRDTNDQKISIPIPKGNFYIGWEQVDISGVKIPIGYDLNSPDGIDFLYFNVGQGWQNAATSSGLRRGSLMIRPVMGDEEVIATPTKEVVQELDLKIFPNPTNGIVHFETGGSAIGDIELEVISILGQQIMKTSLPKDQSIDLSLLEPGTYFIKAIDYPRKLSVTKKITLVE